MVWGAILWWRCREHCHLPVIQISESGLPSFTALQKLAILIAFCECASLISIHAGNGTRWTKTHLGEPLLSFVVCCRFPCLETGDTDRICDENEKWRKFYICGFSFRFEFRIITRIIWMENFLVYGSNGIAPIRFQRVIRHVSFLSGMMLQTWENMAVLWLQSTSYRSHSVTFQRFQLARPATHLQLLMSALG